MRPDWWKLEPSDSADAWRNIERTIVANDTHCRGVVLLGLSAPEAELVASFQVAAAQPLVKRSEEHTSELQSLMRISYAVFCLKKKQQTKRDELGNHRDTK